MAYASSNPWDVPQIDSFNFLCCPECVYRSKEESTFQVRFIQGLLDLDGRNSQKYLHQTWADLLILIILHKLTQSL